MKQPKHRIVISSYDCIKNPWYAGGGAQAVHEVAKRLVRQYDITIIAGTFPGATNETIENVHYRYIGHAMLGPKLGQLYFQAVLLWFGVRFPYDLWVESFTPPYSTSLVPILTKKPVVGLCHSLSGQEMSHRYKLPFAWFEQFGLRRYRQFIVPSQAVANQILQHNKKANISVIPNGVVPMTVLKKSSHTQPTLLWLGRIRIEQKGLDLLLRAFAKLPAATNAHLLLVGSGTADQEKKLTALISNSGVSHRISRMSRVGGKQKAEILQNATAIVLPSRFESFGLTALEAAACGRKPIVFGIPAYDWAKPTYAICVKPFSLAKLTQAMATAISRPQSLRIPAQDRQKLLATYHWDSIAARYAALLSQQLTAQA